MLFGWQCIYIDRPNYIPRRNPRVFIKKPQRKLLSSDALKIKTLSRDNQWPIRVQCNARFGAPARFQSIWYGFNANVFNPYIPWGMNELSALHSQPTRTNSDGPITGQEKTFALKIVQAFIGVFILFFNSKRSWTISSANGFSCPVIGPPVSVRVVWLWSRLNSFIPQGMYVLKSFALKASQVDGKRT